MPWNRACDPRLDGAPAQPWSSVRPCHLGLEPCHFGLEPCLLGLEPCHFGLEPCHFGLEPCHFGLEPCHFGLEPCHFGSDRATLAFACGPGMVLRQYGIEAPPSFVEHLDGLLVFTRPPAHRHLAYHRHQPCRGMT